MEKNNVMSEKQYDFISNDYIDGLSSSKLNKSKQFTYYKVSVEKTSFSDLYLKVPIGTNFERNDIKFSEALDEAAYDSSFWENGEEISYGTPIKIEEREANEWGFTEFIE